MPQVGRFSLFAALRRLCFYMCLSVRRGGRDLQAYTRGGAAEGSGWEVSRPTPKGRGLQAHTRGGGLRGLAREWGGWWGIQVHTRGCIPACTEADPPADSYCCGKYASYWNAFLLMWQIRQILTYFAYFKGNFVYFSQDLIKCFERTNTQRLNCHNLF